MKKKWTRVFILIAFMGELLTQANGEVGYYRGKTGYDDIDYSFLNADLTGRELICDDWNSLLVRGTYDYAQEIQGEFLPEKYDGKEFPEDLVVMMEDILFHSSDIELKINNKSCYYDDKLREFGAAGSFLMGLEDAYAQFPEMENYQEGIESAEDAYKQIEKLYVGVNSDNCYEIHHFSTAEGQDFFLFCYHSRGKDTTEYLHLMKREGNELVRVQTIYKKSHGRGELIQYGKMFYYVYLNENDCNKDFDGIRLVKLNDKAGENTDSVWIFFVPMKYVWNDLSGELVKDKEEIDAYIESVKEELLILDETAEEYGRPIHYLGYGDEYSVTHTYFGDEKKGDVFNLKNDPYGIENDVDMFYKLDMANCGLPLYFSKDKKIYDYTGEYMDARFFYYDSQEKSYKELEQLGYSNGGLSNINLVQMWFKEIGEKIYTCQVYHVGGYNYIFQMLLLEGNRSSVVRTAIIPAKKKFVVMEEKIPDLRE